jgi:hypothetical protein
MPVINEAKRMRQKDCKGAPLSLDPHLYQFWRHYSPVSYFFISINSPTLKMKKEEYVFQTSLGNTRRKKGGTKGRREGGKKGGREGERGREGGRMDGRIVNET